MSRSQYREHTTRRGPSLRHCVRTATTIGALASIAVFPDPTASQSSDDRDTSVHEVRVGDRLRSYRVFDPPRAAGDDRRPVVFAFHGGGGDGRQFQASAGLDAVAAREGFTVVYPNGSGPVRDDRLLTWNAGECCGYAGENAVDETTFFLAILDDLPQHVEFDPDRVYLTGHSNGSMVAYHIAVEASDRVAAVAGVAGAMTGPLPENLTRADEVRPIPILHIHSTDDPRAYYEGGRHRALLGRDTIVHRPVEETLDFWIRVNGCSDEPVETASERWRERLRDAPHTATLLEYGPCTSGAPVLHWKLTEAGHPWPGDRSQRVFRSIVGPTTEVIDAAEEVWAFFSHHTLRGSG